MIPDSFIQDLLNRVDIVDVVGKHVRLKKAGMNYQACCPFHTEKTPSFTVSPTKQFYHCFGCGAHGTAISFLMEYSGLGFVDAVQELATSVGLTVPRDAARGAPAEEADALRLLGETMARAAQFYRDELKKSEGAVAYLKSRGLTGEIAKRFGIGYAPAGWQPLAAAFPDYAASALVRSGLVIEGDEGKRYDRFRDRIMFPITNARGMVIGFGGRVLGQGEPKYLNSPETPLFEKGRELYGVLQARQGMREAGCLVVVEGYMDVVALAQHGVDYAVATLGTATTPVHVQKLLRMTPRVVFCFDGDAAGRKAAWRALENSLEWVGEGKRIDFLFLPQGEDPDSYVRKSGRQGFESLLERDALPLSEFLVREIAQRVDMRTEEGRAQFLESAKPLLARITHAAFHLMLRKRIAEVARISQAELEELYGISVKTPPRRPAPVKKARVAPSLPRRMLALLIAKPALGERLDEEIRGRTDELLELRAAQPGWAASDIEALTQVLEFLRHSPHITTTAALEEQFRGTAHETLLRQISVDLLEWGDDFNADQEFDGAFSQFRELLRKQRIDVLRRKKFGELTEAERAELQRLLHRP